MKGTIAQVSKTIQSILCETTHEVAIDCGLIKRQRKVSGANLCQTLVLGWMSNPEATLEELCQTEAAVGLEISSQGLDQRFTKETGVFLQRMLKETIAVMFSANRAAPGQHLMLPIMILERKNPQGIVIVCAAQDAGYAFAGRPESFRKIRQGQPIFVVHPGCASQTINVDVAAGHIQLQTALPPHPFRHDVVAAAGDGQAQFLQCGVIQTSQVLIV